ncbi:hypothetical protein EUX98_g8558 [Antrodiella citrinella]|uniref:Velvet domain-containing protein n=1 Tax=Antrodiella citrinella TaxID=2447956 RepID=A0A4S4M5S7_9APHY|nr:hypothetical protein EUX98_g8558 [Antrodiella citrinella]
MIQKVSQSRGGPSSAGPIRTTTSDGPESWGQWSGRRYVGLALGQFVGADVHNANGRHYSLEVVQDPVRARMCGFGDKDRRPLAPAAVAKMIVKRDDNSIVDVDEVDCSFFLVTVDLWSADGKHEMNLVLHPTSADRYVPTSTPKAKRRATTNSNTAKDQRSARQSPTPSAAATPTTTAFPQQTPNGMAPFMTPANPHYSAQGYPFPAQNPPPQDSSNFQPIAPYAPPADASNWNYASSHPSGTSPGPVGYNSTAPAHSGEGWHMESSARDDSEGNPYRNWPQEQQYSPIDNNGVSHGPTPIDPSLRGPPPLAPTDMRDGSGWQNGPEGYSQNRYPQEPYAASAPQPNVSTQPPQPIDTTMYASAQYAQQQHEQHAQAQYHQGAYTTTPQETTPPSTIPPLPRHTYTRTLVGPLSANACRLLDEHRKAGIFFLFQDLSIRTEGNCPTVIAIVGLLLCLPSSTSSHCF